MINPSRKPIGSSDGSGPCDRGYRPAFGDRIRRRRSRILLEFRRSLVKIHSVGEAEIQIETPRETQWPEALRADDNAAAIAQLRANILLSLRIALRDRSDVSEAQLEDFAQDSVLRILAQLDRFGGRSQFMTWARTVAIHTAFTELRRKRWQDVSLESLMESGRQVVEESFQESPASDTTAEQSALMEALRGAMAERLSDRQRAAIVGELQGLPFDQIVALLGTNRNAAYKLLHDARKALKQHLTHAGISPETIRTAYAP